MNRIALAGNPNIGKTTIFNALTGANQKVSNWPGVTVHKKEGQFVFKDDFYTVVDLPGTYSLGSYSEDERIATDYVLSKDAQLILNVADATNLERNLYLTVQLLEMEVPVVLALNMMDEAERFNIHIDHEALSETLGIPVVPVTAAKLKGIDVLMETVADELACIQRGTSPRPRRRRRQGKGRPNRTCPHEITPLRYAEEALPSISELTEYLNNSGVTPSFWYALQVLTGDLSPLEAANQPVPEAIQALADELQKDPHKYELDVIDARYRKIHTLVTTHVTEAPSAQEQKSDRIDRILMHPVWGIPIFAAVMFIVFQLTFAVGQDLFGDALDTQVSRFAEWLRGALAATQVHPLITGFITEGLIGGIGTVLTFIPLIVVLYLLIGFLEDIGYMARVAYVMDHFMRKIGLQGKAVVSMDLPFAQGRFDETYTIGNSKLLSDHKDTDFGKNYGFLMEELRLLNRGVVVIDKDGVIQHIEYVEENTNHPDYDKALAAAKALL
jgi:ferrous iron transport protein B